MLDTSPQAAQDIIAPPDKGVSRLVEAVAQAEAARAAAQPRDELTLHINALTRLHALSRQLAGAIELRPAMQAILDTLVELHGASSGLLSLYNPVKNMLEISASAGLGWDIVSRCRELAPNADGGACGHAFARRGRVIVEDTETEEFFAPFRDLARELGFRAVHSTPMFNRRGEVIGVITVHFPVPSRPTQLEMQLADLCAQQAADVAETIRDQQALREADRRKDEFIAILAHELRNPLAPIRNALQAMERSRDPGMQDEARAIISRQVNQMVRLVDDLLDVSRITRGTVDLQTAETTLAAAINAAIETAAPLVREMDHELMVAMPWEDIRLQGDAARLAQMFGNLLHNAARFTPPGGKITVTGETDGNMAIVVIQDNGIGVPAGKIEKIFDIFTQADNTMGRAQGGLGIGLTIARKLAELHGGTIRAASGGPGTGTRVTVTLPLAPAAKKLHEETDDMTTAAQKGDALRVLIVDDNRDSAMTLGWLIEMLGVEYKLAHSGEEALKLASEYNPGLVLMDIGMPGMTGYEVVKKMRDDPALAKTVFAAQTGWGEDQHRKNSKEAGFDHHLVKPLSMKNLQDLLADIQTPKAAG